VRSLGLDLGGTNIKLAIVDSGEIVERGEAPTLSGDGVDAVLARDRKSVV